MKLENITPSITEPVTLAEVKEHLRVEHADDDTYISSLIPLARKLAEDHCDLVLVDQQFRLTLDCFSPAICIPKVPVVSIDSLEYVDPDGATQVLASFHLESSRFKSTLLPAYGQEWPDTESGYDKVTIEFSAGASGGDDVKHAIKLIIGSLYDQREDHAANVTLNGIPWSSSALLAPYKRVLV